MGNQNLVQNLKYEGALGNESRFQMVVFWNESWFFSVESEIRGSSRNQKLVSCGGVLERVLVFECGILIREGG